MNRVSFCWFLSVDLVPKGLVYLPIGTNFANLVKSTTDLELEIENFRRTVPAEQFGAAELHAEINSAAAELIRRPAEISWKQQFSSLLLCFADFDHSTIVL